MTDRQVVAAIRRNHLKANISHFESDPRRWGRPQWSKAWVDCGGTIFGDGPYLHVPIKGGEWDGTVQRVYPPARLGRWLRRRQAAVRETTRLDPSPKGCVVNEVERINA